MSELSFYPPIEVVPAVPGRLFIKHTFVPFHSQVNVGRSWRDRYRLLIPTEQHVHVAKIPPRCGFILTAIATAPEGSCKLDDLKEQLAEAGYKTDTKGIDRSLCTTRQALHGINPLHDRGTPRFEVFSLLNTATFDAQYPSGYIDSLFLQNRNAIG